MTHSDAMIVLQSGGTLCLVAGAYLAALLRFWPRVFLRRFPEEIRAVVPPITAKERGWGLVLGLAFLLMLLGFPLWATLRIDAARAGQASTLSLGLAAYGVWMLFNLFDWLVLDELLIGLVRPRWLTVPGAKHIALRFDHREHAIAFVRGSIIGLFVAALVAWLVASGIWPNGSVS